MESLLLAVAVLACPVGMGAMMWMMMRPGHRRPAADSADNSNGAGGQDQVAQLRAEIEELKAERATQSARDGGR